MNGSLDNDTEKAVTERATHHFQTIANVVNIEKFLRDPVVSHGNYAVIVCDQDGSVALSVRPDPKHCIIHDVRIEKSATVNVAFHFEIHSIATLRQGRNGQNGFTQHFVRRVREYAPHQLIAAEQDVSRRILASAIGTCAPRLHQFQSQCCYF